jgi:hypothetical protein
MLRNNLAGLVKYGVSTKVVQYFLFVHNTSAENMACMTNDTLVFDRGVMY